MKAIIPFLIIVFALGCGKDNGTVPQPVIDSIILPPYQNPYGKIEVTGHSSCETWQMSHYTYWVLSGVVSKNYTLGDGSGALLDHVNEGTVYYEATESCSNKVKTGQAEVHAGQTTYLKVDF